MNQANSNKTASVSGDGNNQSKSLIKLAELLVALHIQRRYFLYKDYTYNYNYLQPLAITNVPDSKFLSKILGVSFPNFPEGSFPSLVWLVKVVVRVIVIAINNYLIKSFNSLNLLKNDLIEIKKEVRKIGADLSQLENQITLKSLVEKLEITLKQIDQTLDSDPQLKNYREQQAAASQKNWFQDLIALPILKLNSKIAQLLKSLQPYYSKDIALFDDYIIASLEKSIKYTTKIAETADFLDKNPPSTPKFPSLDDYNQLYNAIQKPAVADVFQEDLIFAYLQVAGANPLVLKQYTQVDFRLPIASEQYQAIAEKFGVADNLESALAEGRLYVSNYEILGNLVNGNYISPNLVQQKYISAPIALFAVPPVCSSSRSLFPIAISYQKTSISDKWLLFTPLDGNAQGEPWMTAKNIVQMADCNYHELISHLGRTHLVVEAFIVPTYHLPDQHPLKNLLLPHFEGTVLINYGAHAFLVAPGGSVDSLLAATVGADQSLSAKATQSYLFNFNSIDFPQLLVDRGVNDPQTLPIYPYREDGQLIWDAIHTWVNDYFSIYYANDSAVLADANLQNWASTLVSLDGGRLQNFGENQEGQIQTRDYLVKAVSTIIFTASAQHAAVNFAQKALMMYVPGFPLARYLLPPDSMEDQDSFIEGLPSLSQAQSQINTLYLLGSVYYTNLGNYNSSVFPQNAQLQSALQKFQASLDTATTIINERNQSSDRLMPYEFLLPVNIPQSINI